MSQLSAIQNPSPTEQALINSNQIVQDRINWLKSNPPHLAHADLHYSSDAHIKSIASVIDPICVDGVIKEVDRQDKYVNVVNGLRVTTDQPSTYIHQIFYFGRSNFFGHGVNGLQVSDYMGIINTANIQSEDIIICYMPNSCLVKELSIKYQIPIMDFTEYFHRPHNQGEIFIDKGHLNYKGNEVIAEKIVDLYFNPINRTATKRLLRNNVLFHFLDDENFRNYLAYLEHYRISLNNPREVSIGSIVMECNPFTTGHYFLVEIASRLVDILYIFIVEEDKTAFPFLDRFKLVEKGVSMLDNVHVLRSGKFILSNTISSEYFDRYNKNLEEMDASLDVKIFGEYIAKLLE